MTNALKMIMTSSGAQLRQMQITTMLMVSGEIVDCVDLVSVTLNHIEINQQNNGFH